MSKRLKMVEGCYHQLETQSADKVIEIDESGHIVCHPGEFITEKYEFEKVLGEGAYGRVVQVKNVKANEKVALKIFKNQQRELAEIEITAATLISSRDPYDTSLCIKMLDWFDYYGHTCIGYKILGLSVAECMKKIEPKRYSTEHVRQVSRQLCNSVNFLHQNGMIHTDIKPENILFVDSTCSTSFSKATNCEVTQVKNTEIRLIDFVNVTCDSEYYSGLITTRYYRAPEVILELEWSRSCDVWSIGCTLFELYIGDLLFSTNEDCEHLVMMEAVLGAMPYEMAHKSRQKYFTSGKLSCDWKQITADDLDCEPLLTYMLSHSDDDTQLFDLIKKMLVYDPLERITPKEALKHPFFEKRTSH